MKKINIVDKEETPRKRGLFTPAQILAIGFAGVILAGALLLTLPVATVSGQGTGFINALFTSTSAVCVTGLVVVDTGTHYSVFGQIVILLLIQVGGLGFMSIATLYAIILGKRITLKERILLQEAFNQVNLEGIVRLVKYVLQVTFTIEGIGALILAIRWSVDLGWKKAIYFGIFHSVSSFNNAGFDLFGGYRSLVGYVGDVTVNLVIMSLIILGGLGFAVLSELYLGRGKKLSLHSFIVLRATVVLILAGTAIIYILEATNPKTLGPLDPMTRLLSSLFQSVTPRTAGYNTLPIGDFRDSTLLFTILLMFIGASPGSTGGGIKTTTFVSVILSIKAAFTGKQDVVVRERTIPHDMIQKAFAISVLALMLVLVVTMILTVTEKAGFLPLLFDTVSAFATVGLTTGITPSLTDIGKLALAFTMYAGRVGPLTVAVALAQQRRRDEAPIKYPEERILIG